MTAAETTFFENILTVASPVTIFSSISLGLFIGAFYGYMLSPGGPIRYPLALWAVGIMFISTLAFTGLLATGIPPVDFSIGRALLWTFTCGSIPIGRGARMWWDLRRIRHRLDALRKDLKVRREHPKHEYSDRMKR